MKILIIEDDADLREIIARTLSRARYVVETATTAAEARQKVGVYQYDCVLLDIMLPDGSGLDILRGIRQAQSATPVIVCSAKDSIDDKVEGLNLGADDYLPKPFHLAELQARIKSVVRRHSTAKSNRLTVANVEVDPTAHQAWVDGRPLELGRKEMDILAYFMARAGRVVGKEVLAEAVWGDYIDATDSFDFVYAQMKNLRRKLKLAGAGIEIRTVYGFGYKLEEP